MTGRDGSDVALQLPSDIGGFGARKTGLRAIDCQIEGDRSFALCPQPQLDKAADGFGTAGQVWLLPAPFVDQVNNIGRPPCTDLNAYPGGGSAA